MPSQTTLVWAGAAVSAVVVAAGAGAVVWTHPGLLGSNPAPQVIASVPAEPKPAAAPPASSATQAATPTPGGASTPEPKPANETAASPVAPAFDVVNVDPSGDAVIAGRAAPNAKVELRDAGKKVAEATADASGQFVMIPPTLAPGDHNLSLAANEEQGAKETSKSVAVSVPAPETKALATPAPEAKAAATPAPAPADAAASQPVGAMRTVATPAPVDGSRVAIRSVEADGAGALVAKGRAEPNASVRLYLNDAHIADAKTQADGLWSLTIERGMSPGGYLIRADEIGPAGVTVLASVNTPFDYPDASEPVAPIAPAPPSLSAAQTPAPSPADPVIESVQTKKVATGHTLWELSRNYYGDPTRYPEIYEANKWEIHNPNLIYPGEVFVVPKSEPKP